MSAVAVPTLVLTRGEIRALMDPSDYLRAVEQAFRMLYAGRAISASPLSLELAGGSFHGKAAALMIDRPYAVIKWNANFPLNRQRLDLPTIQGALLLCDGESGSLLAMMDSAEVTLRRTAAATALAARLLARSESSTLLVCGCGEQGAAHIEALRPILPLKKAFCWDIDSARALSFSSRCTSRGLQAEPVDDVGAAAALSDVIVTCTTSSGAFLSPRDIRPGTFIAAVGADNAGKSEIEPGLMAVARVVADSIDQCAAMGDLHHAIEAGSATPAGIHGELAEIVAGAKPGRTDCRQITLFDSTGIAVEDAASAVVIYKRALRAGARTRMVLAA